MSLETDQQVQLDLDKDLFFNFCSVDQIFYGMEEE